MILRSIKIIKGARLVKNEYVYGFVRYAYRTERTFYFVWGNKAIGIQWVA